MKKTVGMLLMSAVLVASSTVITTPSQAKPHKLCDFAPKNTRKIPILKGVKSAGLDETTFNKVIDDFTAVFNPMVQAKGATLQINRLWSDDTVNSDTTVDGNTWSINAYGGLARYAGMTYDGYLAVLCHEMGHHLGGYPKYASVMGDSWASNEGEADYFAMMKGFRLMLRDQDNSAVVSTLSIPSTVTSQCSIQHRSAGEIALCQRGSMASLLLASVLRDLGQEPNPVAFDTPDTSQVSATNDDHPAAQCRLDTYFYGSICGASADIEFASDSPIQGACAEENGATLGFRSHCWYKPLNSN